MGIKNLIKVINKFAPNAIQYKTINDYKNKTLGIDANLMIYKIVYAIRKNGYDLKNNGIIVTHIHGMLQKLVSFKKNNIKAIFVFDGIPPKLKEDTMKNRKKIKMALSLKYERAQSQDEKKRYYYHKSGIKSEEIFEVMELIKMFGYPIIESEIEADITLAELSKQNKLDAIVTDDMDILVFGGNTILKNFSIAEKKKFQEISLQKLLKDATLTHGELVDLSILIGCDYCPKAENVGPVKAYKLIKENKSLSNILKKGLAWLPPDYKKAQQFFKTRDKQVNSFKYKEKSVDKDSLLLFMKERYFKEKYINGLIKMFVF